MLFDLDDTLYDRGASFLRWAVGFVDRLGLPVEPARQDAVRQLVEHDARGYASRSAIFDWVKTAYPFVIDPTDDLITAFRTDHAAGLELSGSAAAVLDALDERGIPYGIVTNGSTSQLVKIRRLALDSRARCVYISGIFGVRKPDPAIFLAAASDLGLPPAAILFVGDNPEADIAGATNVGMRTAWLHRDRPWPTHLAPPDRTIGSLADVLPLIAPRR